MCIAQKALSLIKSEVGYELPKNEAGTIALHFVSTKKEKPKEESIDTEQIVEKSLTLIECEFGIAINRNEFNCSRFITHLEYLLKRGMEKKQISSPNQEVFLSISKTYPKTYACVNKIADMLAQDVGISLTHEERLYLMLHVNRLCSRELTEQEL
jgi:beta-glucoside operon transcriptional antiterminator